MSQQGETRLPEGTASHPGTIPPSNVTPPTPAGARRAIETGITINSGVPSSARSASCIEGGSPSSFVHSAPPVVLTSGEIRESIDAPANMAAVRRALNATKREIILETEAMINAAKAEVIGQTVRATSMDRQSDDIRLLSQGLAEVQERMEQLEGKLNLLLATRARTVGLHGSRSPVPRGTRDRRRGSPSGRVRKRELSPCSDSLHSVDAESIHSTGSTADRLRQEVSRRQEAAAEDNPDGFIPRPMRPWKGPKAAGLAEIQPSDPRFADALSYRKYRLLNTDPTRGPAVERDTGVYTRRMSHTMAPLVFDGSKPLSILQFLRTFKSELDGNGRSEGAALLLCPKFMTGDALETFNAQFDLANDGLGGFRTWPGAVQFLLRTYAKDAHIEEALADLDDCVQQPSETEEAFARRLRVKTRRMAGVFTQQDLITKFLRGCHASLKPVLRHTRKLYRGPNAFQDFLEQAVAQGEANRALLQRTPQSANAPTDRKQAKPRRVMAVESHYDDGRVLHNAQVPKQDAVDVNLVGQDRLVDRETVSEGTEYSPKQSSDTFHTARTTLPLREEEDPIGNEVHMVKRSGRPSNNSPRGYPASSSRREQPRWTAPTARATDHRDHSIGSTPQVTFRPTPGIGRSDEICFDCYESGHRKPDCPYKQAVRSEFFTTFIKKNYWRLTQSQQLWLDQRGQTPYFAKLDCGTTEAPRAALDQDLTAGAPAYYRNDVRDPPRPGN